MNSIEIHNLFKSYDDGKVQALNGIDLSIQQGEIFGLTGSDGAGKTTLFRVLATLLLPDEGTASVCGLDVVTQPELVRRRIGYMPGRFSLYKDLTVQENMEFFASVYGTDIEENRHLINDVYVMLEPFRNRPAGKLSGGMKQKLALCCALIHNPDILLLDEPTTGVDPVSRRELWQMLGWLKRECGKTIVVSTPYRDEIFQCDRIVRIDRGQVIQTGSPIEVMPAEEGIRQTNSAVGERHVIEAEGLTRQFGDFVAVDHISFRVREGEIFGFLGANGAGKTTAMRMLCGLSQPTGGWARVAGYDVSTEYEQIKKHIGYMSQRFSLYDDLTLEENFRLFGGIYGLKQDYITERFEKWMRILGLWDVSDKLVRSLPLGWKQKLAFSISVFHHPQIVFLDEPTGGVDAETRKQFWELIYETARHGVTVFVTTHYMDEADYCDRVSIMVDGRIEALDTPDNLKRQFDTDNMYDVFYALARRAQRS